MTLNFKDSENEFIELLNQNPLFVLATSSENHVTARTISCINIGYRILFQTDRTMVKYKQIEANPHVALAIKNIQIEGKALLLGHSLNSENNEYISLYKEKHPVAYSMYSHLPESELIEINPLLVTLWKYIEGKSYRDIINFETKIAKRPLYV